MRCREKLQVANRGRSRSRPQWEMGHFGRQAVWVESSFFARSEVFQNRTCFNRQRVRMIVEQRGPESSQMVRWVAIDKILPLLEAMQTTPCEWVAMSTGSKGLNSLTKLVGTHPIRRGLSWNSLRFVSAWDFEWMRWPPSRRKRRGGKQLLWWVVVNRRVWQAKRSGSAGLVAISRPQQTTTIFCHCHYHHSIEKRGYAVLDNLLLWNKKREPLAERPPASGYQWEKEVAEIAITEYVQYSFFSSKWFECTKVSQLLCPATAFSHWYTGIDDTAAPTSFQCPFTPSFSFLLLILNIFTFINSHWTTFPVPKIVLSHSRKISIFFSGKSSEQ